MLRSIPKCPQCKKRFLPEETNKRIHPECIDAWYTKLKATQDRKAQAKKKEEARVERTVIKRRKEAIKTKPKLIKEAQHAFNAYIRERDRGQPCICCGAALIQEAIGGGYDCGHYRSTGSAGHLRFHEDNAHGQRKYCNQYGSGRAVDYRLGLLKRIGLERVESLEADQSSPKWTHDDLRAIKALYVAKLKELKEKIDGT